MNSNVISFPTTRAEKGIGGVVYHLTESIARRTKFLREISQRQDEGHRMVRKRTITRCMSVLNQKGKKLEANIQGLRKSGDISFETAMNIFAALIQRKNGMNVLSTQEYGDTLKKIPPSKGEIELIIQLLFGFGLTPSQAVDSISGHIISRIHGSEDDVYGLIRGIEHSRNKKT